MAKNTNKITRLSKAAREFNVSTATIVEYLNKKGFELASNPNSKLSPEMYELVLKEYSGEKSVKEEAKRQSQQKSQKKNESITIEDVKTSDTSQDIEDDEEEEADTVFIKNVKTPLTSKTDAKSNIIEDDKSLKDSSIKLPGIKVVGNIKDTSVDKKPDIEKPKVSKTNISEDISTTDIQEQSKSESIVNKAESIDNNKVEKKENIEPKVTEPTNTTIQETTKEREIKSDSTVKEKEISKDKPSVDDSQKVTTSEPSLPKERNETDKNSTHDKKVVNKTQEINKKVEDKAKENRPEKETVKETIKEIPNNQKKKETTDGTRDNKTIIKKTKKPSEQKIDPQKDNKKDQPIKDGKENISNKKKRPETSKKPVNQPVNQKAQTEAKKPVVPSTNKKVEDKNNKSSVKETNKKADEDSNFIVTKVQKLEGVKVLGTIDLPEKRKAPAKKKPQTNKPNNKTKKPIASSSDKAGSTGQAKKRKRRRINPTTPNKPNTNTPRPNQQSDNKHKPRKRKAQPVRHEPSEEDVQKQLKETLARLSGQNKKSKASKYRKTKRDAVQAKKEKEGSQEKKNVIEVTEFVTVNELASMMNVDVKKVISTCMQMGLFVSINQRIDAENISMLADEFGYEVEFVSAEVQEALDHTDENEYNEEDLEQRAPIVTVMGHVDHGKTSLLDFIRKANVIEGEAGGITQHIGAYDVTRPDGRHITFLDTPGHEAFTAMRARGAKVTDVAIIIIAADDKIMPQSIEAINHAQAAGVPIVFAINKIDKPGANPERIKEELAQKNLLVEEWGGKYQSHDISAKKGIGVDELLEKVLLEAELLELKGNPNRLAKGTVIESLLDKGRGYVAKLLVQDGTLRKGDYVLAGSNSGKVKAMYNERNKVIDEAGPSTPVLMLGLDGAPQAGDQFNVLTDEKEAKNIANRRKQLQREMGIRTQKHVTLDEIGRRIAVGDFKELNIIVKGDVDGSVEALSDALLKESTSEIQLNVIHKSVGQISESDVMLASASDAIIIGFQVRPSLAARKLAEDEQIDIRTYSVIYKAIEEIKAAMEGMLSPDIEEKITCNVEVREVFKITKVGTIAGCMVLDGVITRNTKIRVIRDGIVIYTGHLGSLKRFKDDVKEVKANFECGLNIENFNDIKVGDIIEGFEEVEVLRKL